MIHLALWIVSALVVGFAILYALGLLTVGISHYAENRTPNAKYTPKEWAVMGIACIPFLLLLYFF